MLLVLAALVPVTRAISAEVKRSYHLLSDDATISLRQFVEQSGEQVVYLIPKVRGVKTNAVKGEFTAREVLDRMVANTPLVIVQDERTGALAVTRASPPSALQNKPQVSEPPKSMKRNSFIGILSGWLALALTPAHAAQSESGSIQGRVSAVASGKYLENAHVTVKGTTLETLSNSIGDYRLPFVPVGETQLSVTYTGMEPQTITVHVAPQQTSQQDFSLALAGLPSDSTVVQLEKFTVQERELTGLAVALDEQRNAPNIKNVVSVDQYGNLGEGNIGEFLKYVPGVSVNYNPATPGGISLRGMPATGTIVMVDGEKMADAIYSRAYDFESGGSGNLERVEISKVPTPEMPANAVGGTINMITKSGFSRSKPLFSYNVFLTHNSPEGLEALDANTGKRAGIDPRSTVRFVQPAVDLSYIWPVNKKLAFTFALNDAPRYSDYTYFSSVWDRVKLIQTQYRFGNLIYGDEHKLASATVDWKISEKQSVRASFQATSIDYITRGGFLFYNAGAGAVGGPDFTQGAATAVGNANMTDSNTDQKQHLYHGALRYRYDGLAWKIDADASSSQSRYQLGNAGDGLFLTMTTTIPNLVMRWEGIAGINTDKIPKLTATDKSGAPVNVFDGGNYPLTNVTYNTTKIFDRIEHAGANARRDFNSSIPIAIKFGAAIDREGKDTWQNPGTLNFVPPGGANLIKNYDLIASGYSDRLTYTDITDAPINVRWPSAYKAYNLYKDHPDWFVNTPANQASNWSSLVLRSLKVDETISAGYVRGDVKFFNNRLWLVGGGRYERTMDKGWGPLSDIRATYQQDAKGNLLLDATGNPIKVTTDVVQLAHLQLKERGLFTQRSYGGFYPSGNAMFEISDNLTLRAGYARTIGRPELNAITPGATATDPAAPSGIRTITITNSSLRPWTSNNYDLTLESYGLKGAVGSLSLYRKDISSFFTAVQTPATSALLAAYGFSDDYLDYNIITKTNSGDASISGLEFSYRQSLLFLPAWGRGLQAYFNMTSQKLSGPNANDFTEFSPRNIAWGLSYSNRRFIGKLNVAQSKFIRAALVAPSATTPANTYSYTSPQTKIELSLEYRFSRGYALYASARNLASSLQRTGSHNPTTPDYAKWDSYVRTGTLFTLGVKGEF